jgi:hypothetical protein
MGCLACPACHCHQPLSYVDLRNLLASNAVKKASPGTNHVRLRIEEAQVVMVMWI